MTYCQIRILPGTTVGALPLVLLHGWGHSSQIWQPLCERLGDARDIWLVDWPNPEAPLSGLTTWQPLIAELITRLPPAYLLLGWSLGGNLTIQLASQSRAPKALLTLATNPRFVATPDWPDAMSRAVFAEFCQGFAEAPEACHQRFVSLQLQGETDRKALKRQLASLTPQPMAILAGQYTLGWLGDCDQRQTLQRLLLPQRHFYAENDALVPAKIASQIADSERLPGGHLLPLTQIDAIQATLAQLAEAAQRPRKQRVAQSFANAATTYDAAAQLQVVVGDRLLAYMPTYEPQDRLLDLGCGTGFISRRLAPHRLIALDIADGMLRQAQLQGTDAAYWLQADAEHLPLATQSQLGVLANLSLQWCDLNSVLPEVYRVLQPGGWCLFSTLGPRSLWQLKSAWQYLDRHIHVNHFTSAEVVHQALNAAGLHVTVFETAMQDVTQPQLLPLLKQLQAIGAKNSNPGQKHGLMTPKQWQNLQNAYEVYRDAEGNLPVSYEVFYVLAHKPAAMG